MGRRYFRAQKYRKLRAECCRKRSLFVDIEFPPTNTSLFLDERNTHKNIEWKRPGELVANPKLFVEGATPNDVTQGILGNCWFVSACSALTHNEALLNKVIPEAKEQEWSNNNAYCGIFRFCFWRFDEWIEVVVDDLLPTRDGKLLFARSKTPNEFWSALLEKAFAKLYGCYENLVGGQLADALQDVSGGVAETLNVSRFLNDDKSDSRGHLFRTVKSAFDQKALIVAAIATKKKEEIEETLSCGLVKGHAYAVTAVRYIDLDAKGRSFIFFTSVERQMMIRLQNPWGEKEWNGPWSDGSTEWAQVTDAQKKEIGITVDEDGEFWMPWNEFIRYFTDISICQLFNTSIFSFTNKYYEWKVRGEWKSNGAKGGGPNDRAGGCLNFAATFCSNPQYLLDIGEDGGEVMLALTQREKNEGEKKREPFVTIGMHIMKVENNRKHRIHQPINPVATSDYANARSVFLHLRDLKAGRYIVLPTTFAPREHAEYLLRMYSMQYCSPRALEKHSPSRTFCTCKKVISISRITIVGAKFHSFDAKPMKTYCMLTSGKEVVRTATVEDVTISWNETYIFYKRELRHKYLFEIYEERTLKDRLLGRAHVRELVDNDSRQVDLELHAADGKKTSTLTVIFQSYDDPVYL
uniref:Calpain catalytic domain-containing protein n=2 Tax=Parascaris univalens TaxID=6257 RepID=A0A915AZC1_PARUN